MAKDLTGADATKHSLTQGAEMARSALKRRDSRLKARAKALKALPMPAPADSRASARSAHFAADRLSLLGAARSRGMIIAEGDSWFDYLGLDILAELEDAHGYDVESVAHKGDRVEEMAYDDGQLEAFIRAIDRSLRRGVIPVGTLLSGGGNDVAGDTFATMLNHKRSASPGLNLEMANAIIQGTIRASYVVILSALKQISQERLGRQIPVLLHGYDYPVADGRGFLGGWWLLPGPWLEPGFRAKGYDDSRAGMAERAKITATMIDMFNAMLAGLAALPQFAHVRHVDLRGTLSTDPKIYKRWWANELHPTPKGFALVTEKIAAALH